MNNRVQTCDRCDSKIVEPGHHNKELFGLSRNVGDGAYESRDALLCSMCYDDLWEFVFETEIDRSDKADPVPIESLSNSVERHIDELDGVLKELEALIDE